MADIMRVYKNKIINISSRAKWTYLNYKDYNDIEILNNKLQDIEIKLNELDEIRNEIIEAEYEKILTEYQANELIDKKLAEEDKILKANIKDLQQRIYGIEESLKPQSPSQSPEKIFGIGNQEIDEKTMIENLMKYFGPIAQETNESQVARRKREIKEKSTHHTSREGEGITKKRKNKKQKKGKTKNKKQKSNKKKRKSNKKKRKSNKKRKTKKVNN